MENKLLEDWDNLKCNFCGKEFKSTASTESWGYYEDSICCFECSFELLNKIIL